MANCPRSRQCVGVGVEGINHITLAVHDVSASIEFYRDVLGCRVIAEWSSGAYLLAGGAWLALVAGNRRPEHPDDYSHVAFDVAPHEFDGAVAAIGAAGCEVWQDNWTEGESLYFRDPSGHRLEIHAATLAERLAAAAASPWEGLSIAGDARRLASAAPTVRDTKKPRRFSCSPVGVCVLVFDDEDRVLLLRPPGQEGWEAVSGAVEASESLDAAARREMAEELGPTVTTGPLVTVHAYTVDYDPDLPSLVSIVFATRYGGGEVRPADDMIGADMAWVEVDDIVARLYEVAVPTETSVFARAKSLLALEE